MFNPRVHAVAWPFLLIAAIQPGCQRYVRQPIEVRDAATHQPVKTNIEVGYDLREELSRQLTMFTPALKRCKTQTDENGRAEIRVAPEVAWFILIGPDGERQSIAFHDDGTPSHSFGIVYVREGWMSTRMFAKSGVAGTLEVRFREP